MRVINVIALVAVLVLAVGLYKAKTEAVADEARIATMEAQLVEEREVVQILRNEIAHLESPARLRALAEEHLGMTTADPVRIIALEDAPLFIPEAVEDGAVDQVAPDDEAL